MIFRNLPHEVFASPARQAVLRELLRVPELEQTGRAIARRAGISPTWTVQTLQKLEWYGLVRRRSIPPLDLWWLNRDHALVEEIRHFLDLDSRAWAQIRRSLQPILRRPGVTTAILYGSVARRQERPNSDIDLLVIVDNLRTKSVVEAVALTLSLTFGRRFGNVLHAIVYTKAELQRKRGLALIKSVRRDGIVLKGAGI